MFILSLCKYGSLDSRIFSWINGDKRRRLVIWLILAGVYPIQQAISFNVLLGVSLCMLGRIQGIIAALKNRDGSFSLYRVDLNWYRSQMVSSRSKASSATKIMMVSCRAIREQYSYFAEMSRS